MTISKIIEHFDKLRPNPFSTEDKIYWLSQLDGKVANEIFRSEFVPYKGETEELLIKEPYTDIYIFYLSAMSDFFSRDYGEYNNSASMYSSLFEKYKKDVKRRNIFKKNNYKNLF